MSRTWEKEFTEEVAEGTTFVFKDGLIQDELGAAIALADLVTVRLWLYRPETPTSFINSRSNQDIKNLNGGVIASTGGAFTLTLGPADNVLVSQSIRRETHEILIEYTYSGGAKKGRVVWRYPVVQLRVPTS